MVHLGDRRRFVNRHGAASLVRACRSSWAHTRPISIANKYRAWSRWVAALTGACLLATGCASTSTSGRRVDPTTAADAPRTPGARATTPGGGVTGTPTPSSAIPVSGRPDALIYDMSGTKGAGFVSPSGNIACAIWTKRSGLYDSITARCDLSRYSYDPPPEPRRCDTDYGQTVELDTSAHFVCAGDTLADYVDADNTTVAGYTAWFDPDTNPTVRGRLAGLDYGNSIKVDQVTCTSTRSGVRCRNTHTGAGFRIAREDYRLRPRMIRSR